MAKTKFDVFLSHSHTDAACVEDLAKRLIDQENLNPWLDKWEIVSGSSWQQAISKGLEEAGCCAICLGANLPDGWFQKECEVALNQQAASVEFRVIPVLIKGANPALVSVFLKTNDWIDFRNATTSDYMFYRLVCGIRGQKPGRYEPKPANGPALTTAIEAAFAEIRDWEAKGLVSKLEAAKQRNRLMTAYFTKKLSQMIE